MESKRTCQGCTFCCRMALPGNPHGHLCKHAEPGRGCRIYSTRPDYCSRFECCWVGGVGNIRPDELGAMFFAPNDHEIHMFYTAKPDDKLINEELRIVLTEMCQLSNRDVIEVHMISLRPGTKHARVWEYRRLRDDA